MRKILTVLLAAACSLALFTACGDTANNPAPSGSDNNPGVTDVNDGIDPNVDYTALAGTTIKVGATPKPHAEILEKAKEILAAKDITLEIVEFTDYVQPNTATEDGTLDANFFQHLAYLKDFNQENQTHLVSAGSVHYEPLGLYPGKTKTLDELPDGATIAVPNDPTNEARALSILVDKGLITLKDDAALLATARDIADNPKNLEISEMEAAQMPRVLDSIDMAVINGNYALQADLQIADAVAVENASADDAIEKGFANALVVKEGNENNDAIKALYAAITSEAVRTLIETKYTGSVAPLF